MTNKEIVQLDLPSNSHKSKEAQVLEEKVKVEKVIKTQARRRKKSLGKKFSEVFMEDDTKSVGSYLLNDVLIPALKDTVVDMVSSGIEMLIFGTGEASTSSRKKGRYGKGSYTPYNSISEGKKKGYKTYSSKGSGRYILDDVIVDTRGEAFEIIHELDELIEEYGLASVADLNDLIGETGEFVDNKWGWYDLGSSRVERVKDGYLVNLPKVKYLD